MQVKSSLAFEIILKLICCRESKFSTAGPTIWTPPCARRTRSTSVSCNLDQDKKIKRGAYKPVALRKSNNNSLDVGVSLPKEKQQQHPCGEGKLHQGGGHQVHHSEVDKVHQGGGHQVHRGHQVYTAPATSPLERRYTAHSHLGRVLGKYEVGFEKMFIALPLPFEIVHRALHL